MGLHVIVVLDPTYALINLRKLFVSPFCIKITDMVEGQYMNTNSTD